MENKASYELINGLNMGMNSIDQMMQYSGMFDNDYENNRSRKNGGKRNNNSRGKNRDRY